MTIPFDETLGLRRQSASGGAACYEVDVDERFHNPRGRLRGGLLSSLADAAMGAAFLSTGEPGTNMDLSLRFLRPFWTGRLTATATTVQRGHRIGLIRCDIRDDTKRLIATADSHFIVIEPRGPPS